MMLTAATIGVIANITGLYVSLHFDIAAGPAMVLVATAIFGVAFVLSLRKRRV